MANRILLFVRHGHYLAASSPPDEPDGPLSPKGVQQVRATAQRLRQLPVQVIHHSTLQRATETARLIAPTFPTARLKPSALLRECIPCVPAGFEAHFAHIPADFIAGGLQQAQTAVATFCQPAPPAEEDLYEIIVSHGNLINFLVSQAVKAPQEAWIHFDIQHGGLSEIFISANGLTKLVRHNDTGHLPAELQSFV